MEKDWVKVFSTTDAVRAELMKSFLAENDIQAVVINKKETLSVIIGEAEVYVARADAMKAANLLKSNPDA